MNVIRTEGGEELIILSRSEYEALLAGAPDTASTAEAHEDAADVRAFDEAHARIASGEDVVLPETVWRAMEAASVGERVRILRKHRGLSQTQVAQAADLAQAYLSELEAGKKAFRLGTLERICRALDVPVHVVMLDD